MKVAVIGGTGMSQLLLNLSDSHRLEHKEVPEYGGPVFYEVIEINGREIYFIDRHHSLGWFSLPHQLLKAKAQQRYMYVLSQVFEVDVVLATSAVGAIRNGIHLSHPQVGEIYCPTDAIDYTGLPVTFADRMNPNPVIFHRSMDDLFCRSLACIMAAVDQGGVQIKGILGSSLQGPRFETKAEINRYQKDGVDFLSMHTCFPEAVLAREAGMSYGLLACVSNVCPEAVHVLSGDQVRRAIADQQMRLAQIILKTIEVLDRGANLQRCSCRQFRSVFDLSTPSKGL